MQIDFRSDLSLFSTWTLSAWQQCTILLRGKKLQLLLFFVVFSMASSSGSGGRSPKKLREVVNHSSKVGKVYSYKS